MQNNIQPLKKFSQNFLTNIHYQKKIVDALSISKDDIVVEIGPGLGALTRFVIEAKPAKLYVVEIDNRLLKELEDRFGKEIQIINSDILETDFGSFIPQSGKRLKILGNLPYHITSPILFKLIDHYKRIDQAVIMVQKEVAKRIAATARGKDYGILSVTSQAYAQTEYLFDVTRGNFNPAPEVDSAILRFSFYDMLADVENEPLFRRIIRSTFNYRRKMLRNSLGRILDKSIVYSLPSEILEQRPEELSVMEFKTLSNAINQLLRQVNA